MKVSATLRHANVPERKARLVAGLVRGLSVRDAERQLKFSQKKSADLILGLLRSAVANAQHNNNLDPETLKVESVLVDGAGMFKRYQPRAFGRAYPIRRRRSHITLTIEGEVAKVAPKKKSAQPAKKAEKKAETSSAPAKKAEKASSDSAAKKAPKAKKAAKK
ncbi:MAG: 50S ribosomal protein L22 [Candidatus Doudnabacteria bacterium]|nr:50S ribosomal protein L22 [Candidatus Doudnabacteria bacterium]MCA9387684.1 50S ribosomal protein L22 [Candidatus Andersenbacteria bacterium]